MPAAIITESEAKWASQPREVGPWGEICGGYWMDITTVQARWKQFFCYMLSWASESKVIASSAQRSTCYSALNEIISMRARAPEIEGDCRTWRRDRSSTLHCKFSRLMVIGGQLSSVCMIRSTKAFSWCILPCLRPNLRPPCTANDT